MITLLIILMTIFMIFILLIIILYKNIDLYRYYNRYYNTKLLFYNKSKKESRLYANKIMNYIYKDLDHYKNIYNKKIETVNIMKCINTIMIYYPFIDNALLRLYYIEFTNIEGLSEITFNITYCNKILLKIKSDLYPKESDLIPLNSNYIVKEYSDTFLNNILYNIPISSNIDIIHNINNFYLNYCIMKIDSFNLELCDEAIILLQSVKQFKDVAILITNTESETVEGIIINLEDYIFEYKTFRIYEEGTVEYNVNSSILILIQIILQNANYKLSSEEKQLSYDNLKELCDNVYSGNFNK